MVSKPTATSFAILGLLALQPWTAYELVAQAQRNLRYYWPRSEAHIYAELKRIVERGHAIAEVEDGQKRQRTRYTLTAEGRRALTEWLATPPAPAVLEVEGFLRLFLGDQGTKEDLIRSLEATARYIREQRPAAMAVVKGVLEDGGPFPQRLHLVVDVAEFFDSFNRLLVGWCDRTVREIELWPDTRDIGLTPEVRQRLQRLLDKPDP
jgi:DNA-binding PadR family transcriptional regulator